MQIDPDSAHTRSKNDLSSVIENKNQELVAWIAKPRVALGNSNSRGASALHELPFYLRLHLRPTNTPSHIGEDDTCGVQVTLALERSALHRTNLVNRN